MGWYRITHDEMTQHIYTTNAGNAYMHERCVDTNEPETETNATTPLPMPIHVHVPICTKTETKTNTTTTTTNANANITTIIKNRCILCVLRLRDVWTHCNTFHENTSRYLYTRQDALKHQAHASATTLIWTLWNIVNLRCVKNRWKLLTWMETHCKPWNTYEHSGTPNHIQAHGNSSDHFSALENFSLQGMDDTCDWKQTDRIERTRLDAVGNPPRL